MYAVKKYFAPTLAGLIVATLSSWAAAPARSEANNPNLSVTVTIYQVDSQCQTLLSEKVTIPSTSPIEAAVGKVLEAGSTSDFDLAGYRVSLNSRTGVATIDFRLAPDSPRKFTSLSMCEQFALFGSLRKTLTENQSWKIKDVRFTEQGQQIYL